MSNPDPFKTYLQKLQQSLSTGAATEHTHRLALQYLLEAVSDGVSAINEPKHVECGAPDYIITRAKTPIGYVEAKDVGTSLMAVQTAISALGILLKRIGLKEPMLGQKATSTVCFTAVRP